LEKISLQKIKWLRSLKIKKNRDESAIFIAEGEKIVGELIKFHSDKINLILSSQDLFDQLELSRFKNTFIGSTSDFEKVTNLSTPPKIIAVASKLDRKEIEKNKRIIILDGIQDPGNLGTIIRTADWFGLEQIVVSADTASCFNPKVIQSTMGSILRVDVIVEDLEALIQSSKMPVYGAVLEGKSIQTTELAKEGLLIIGNESKGIRSPLLEMITHPITIPKYGAAESLNAAVATGIILAKWQH
jgi:TrmH family RNA methyltransferase